MHFMTSSGNIYTKLIDGSDHRQAYNWNENIVCKVATVSVNHEY